MTGTRTKTDPAESLRRVAIVLTSLPAPVASRLLGTVDTESKRRLRQQMSALGNVDPIERRLALQDFKGSVVSQRVSTPVSVETGDDEFVISDAAQRTASRPAGHSPADSSRSGGSRVVSSPAASANHSSAPATPLSFLEEIGDGAVANLLLGEHPQAIALVLASIQPAHAARILPLIDENTRTETLSRIGRLGDPPQDAVHEIAQHLKGRVAQLPQSERSSRGSDTLQAILAAMPKVETSSETAATSDRHPNARSQQERRESAPGHEYLSSPINGAEVDDRPALKIASGTTADAYTPADDESSDSQQQPTDVISHAVGKSPFESTDAIHHYLLELSPAELCAALGKVETREALLCLCGLPNEIANAVIAELPRSQARQVQQGLQSLGSLELREIDIAKEAVANASFAVADTATHRAAA